MKTLLVLALDGMMDSGFAITLDTLRTAQALAAKGRTPTRLRVAVAGARKAVRTGAGLKVEPEYRFADVLDQVRPDWILLPGLGLTSEEAITERLAQRDARAAMALLQRAPASACLAVSCSSVFLMAEAGLLDGRTATTTWWLAHLFRARYPDVRLDEARMLVRDGACLTVGSAYAQLDLMLAVVADVFGAAVAHLCSRYLLIDQRPSQARYMIQAHTQQVDPAVVAAERWVDAHLSEPIRIGDLAAHVGVSPKTLARRLEAATGGSPLQFVQRRRLMHAAHLIETTDLSIEAVAEKVGYQDGTALRKLMKRTFGTTPGALRA